MIITIAGVDKSAYINWETIEIEQNVTSQADFMKFTIQRLDISQTYCPAKNDEVIFTDGSTRLFAGRILEITKNTDTGVSGNITIRCKDYALEADRKQVIQVYEGKTVSYIVKDIASRYLSDGIKAGSFDGIDDFCTVPSNAKNQISTAQSFSFWVKFDTITAINQGILAKNDEYLFRLDANKIVYRLWDGVDWEPGVQTGTLIANTWYHIVGTHSISGGSATKILYINGAQIDTNAQAGTFTPAGGAMLMGKWAGGEPMDGLLDEVVLYNKVLSPSEVTALYNSGYGTYVNTGTDVYAIYHYDEGSGITANDSSGYGNNGTMTSGATYDFGIVSSNVYIKGVNTISDVVQKIKFNYITVGLVFKELCDITDCEWFIDYNRNLIFRKKGATSAPFSLLEDKESFIASSFRYKDDLSQIRNAIYVRGGTQLYTTDASSAEIYVADGQQRVFPLGQKYPNDTSFSVAKDSGAGYVALTVGIYGTDLPASFNVLYDLNNRSLIFPDGSKPSSTNKIRVYGNYYLPVIIYKTDSISVTNNGLFEWRIVDTTIGSKNEAIQRALSELLKYANSLSSGSFSTYKDGLIPGMMITATLPSIGISGTYYIKKIVKRFKNNTGTITIQSNCEIIGSEVIDTIDVLLRLLITDVSKKIEIGDDEILDTIYGYGENVVGAESTFTATAHPTGSPTFTETVTNAEVNTVQPVEANIDPHWVAGNFFPDTGYSTWFSGSQTVAIPSGIVFTGAFSICGWFYHDSAGDRMLLGRAVTDTNKIGFYTNKWFIRLISGGTGDNAVSQPTVANWHFFTITRDGSNKVDLYVDGGAPTRLFSDVAQSGTITYDEFGYPGQLWLGRMDGFRFYDRALTSGEITALYNYGNGVKIIKESNLKLAYEFDDNFSTTKVIDGSGNNKTGTFGVTPTWLAGKITDSYTFLSRKRVPKIDAGLLVQ